MNNIEEAAGLLERGWCEGDLKDGDAHCAVGAVAATTGAMVTYDTYYMGESHTYIDSGMTYAAFDKTPEAKALATEVMESEWFASQEENWKRLLEFAFNSGEYCEVVFNFNDKQDTKEPVIEMFKYAAKRMH